MGKHIKEMIMMPAPQGTCPECAVNHSPDQPHNQQSLFYQYHFFNEYGRWPTWGDAMAHCTEEVKAIWREALELLDTAEDEISNKKTASSALTDSAVPGISNT